ncbi:MAG TPA: FAD-dependent oxidoreductase [Reyranella sp.]|nr:FAD-dependent oxidoreductase [Reyranella sp.]
MTDGPKKVVVVGGGVSGMVAAMALTQPELGGRFDVTVYQMGWRLGGKGASGRNAAQAQRIEEHGLHIWFGFYDNAFTWMRRCYEELDRPPGAPLRTLDDAFKPQDNFIFTELIDGKWREWLIDIPRNEAQPGGHPTIWESIQIVLGWLEQQLKHVMVQGVELVEADLASIVQAGPFTLIEQLKVRFGLVRRLCLHDLIAEMRLAHEATDKTTSAGWGDGLVTWLGYAAEFLWTVIGPKVRAGDDEARRLWILAYLGMVSIRGILADDLLKFGYDHVNNETFHQWLERHAVFGATEPGDPNGTAFWGAPVRAFFDAAFAYAEGDTNKPNMAAGIAIRGIQRIALGYKGAVVYEMQAGMGDTVFTPFYEVLKRRGVKFEFFSRAGELTLAADGKSVAGLAIHRQVKLKNGYDPLVPVGDLPCWPSEPLYDQIVDGDKLAASGADLSHYNTGGNWAEQPDPTILAAGVDFDHIVLAAALPSLPQICPGAIAALPAWKTMVDKVSWTRTQAFQLWMTKTKDEIGLPGPPAVVGSYVEPWSSITDFTHLLPREDWPASYNVKFLTYSCGVMPESDPADQKQADALVFSRVKDFLENDAAPIWPGTIANGSFDWSVLAAAPGTAGVQRLAAQYWRANVDTTELYVLSTPEGIANRIAAGNTGLSNLVFAGDWTDNGFNIGSVEGAVMSGLQAAEAVSGVPMDIISADGT